MMIETDKELKRGDRLVFRPPRFRTGPRGSGDRQRPGEASGARSSRYGLRFTGLTPDAKQAFQAFVDRRSSAAA